MSSSLLSEPDDTFEEIGGGPETESPGDNDVVLEVASDDLPRDRLVHGTLVYLHVWMCDAFLNCGSSTIFSNKIETSLEFL